ncbi:MAG: VOC family protein [Thermoplasmata archaeon]|nr:VOC family protein [Thermoplasmata archaeon]
MVFAHVSVRTSDMDRSIRFYESYFGMKLVSRKEIPQNNAEIAFLESEGTNFRLELTWYKTQKMFEQAEYENRVFNHLAFTVDDMDAVIERMRSAGVIITDEPFTLGPGGSKLAFIEDPDGTLIELIEKR